MPVWLADPPFFGGPGQGRRQIVELFVPFGLTSLIGLEREIQGKSAGVRTQTIVGKMGRDDRSVVDGNINTMARDPQGRS